MAEKVTVAELIGLMDDPAIALVDVRETAEYNTAHIPQSWSLPRRLIETRMIAMVPWRGTRVVVCDDDGRRAALAARTLESMGYGNVAVLAGGTNRWVTDGQTTDWGLNVPSKDFGERILMQEEVPELGPDQLHEWLSSGDKIVLVDSRTPEEHNRSCIPGSRSMPGAELGLRVWDLVEDDKTRVVVHCAGRTRSIIGAATLKRMGVPNVYCLKNGTMGWQLAGLELETGSQRLDLPEPTPQSEEHATQVARRVAQEQGVRYIDIAAVDAIAAKAVSENVYLIDVRTREEYAAGHIPGFTWVPGGQAVQATDSYVGVKGGTLVFACDGSVRSSMTASWFRSMGFPNVYVLDGGIAAWQAAGRSLEAGAEQAKPAGYEAASARVKTVSPADLQGRLTSGAVPSVVFTGTSEEFSDGHIESSHWLPRGWLELWAEEAIPDRSKPVVVTDTDGIGSVLAAAALLDMGYSDVTALEGGTRAWARAGNVLQTSLAGITRAPDDILPVRRSYAEMLNYLRWEEQLGEKYAHKS